MIKRFKSFSFINLAILFVVLLALWILSFWVPIDEDNSLKLSIFSHFFDINNYFIRHLTMMLLFVSEVVFYIFLTQKFNFTQKNSLISVLVFILLGGFFGVQIFSPVLLAMLVFFFSLVLFLKAIDKEKDSNLFFLSGLIFFVTALIYHPFVLVILFIPFVLISIRQRLTKELLAFYLAFIVGVILFIEILWLINGNLQFIKNEIEASFVQNEIFLTDYDKIYLLVIGLYFLMSLFFVLRNAGFQEVGIRIVYKLFFVFFLFFATVFAVPAAGKEVLQLLIVPTSFFIGYYFDFAKESRINKILFTIFFLLPFAYQLSQFFV